MPFIPSTPFPDLTTERLFLRQLQISDEINIVALRSDENVNKYIERPKKTTAEEAREFIKKINTGIEKNAWFYWAITLKESSELIGTICYWNFSDDYSVAELGYELLPYYQGKGIMQEALSKVIEFGFQSMSLQTIQAYTHKDNERSNKLLLKNHFQKVTEPVKVNNETEIVFILNRP